MTTKNSLLDTLYYESKDYVREELEADTEAETLSDIDFRRFVAERFYEVVEFEAECYVNDLERANHAK